ncbi:MAG: hypothetical protein AB7S71_22475 [Dongiaceae bacterium]
MDRDMSWPREEAAESSFRSRSRRPMTRAQEIAVLAVAFAVGAGLQVAYLINGAPTLP